MASTTTPHQTADLAAPPARGGGAPWERADTWLLAILLLGTSYLYVWGLGSYPLWDPWEPKYAVSLREMTERGDYITPWFDDRIRWTKPILVYWAMKLPIAVLGDNEFAVRLPSALAAVAAVLALFVCLRELRGRRTAFVAACVLATLPQYVYMARQAMPDMLLAACLTVALGCFAVGRFGLRRPRAWFLAFYAATGLAVLAKGPVAAVIVLFALGVFALVDVAWSRLGQPATAWAEVRALARRYHVAAGALTFTLIAAPWYVAMLAIHGRTFIDRFVMDENLQRFSEPIREHHGTAAYYLQDLVHGFYPWIGLLVVGLPFLFRATEDQEVRQRWYWFSWPLAVLALFTLAGTKLDHYILPMTAGVAVLVGLVLEECAADSTPFWVRPALIVAALFPVVPVRDFLVEGSRYLVGVFTNARTIEHPQLETALQLFGLAWGIALFALAVAPRSRAALGAAVLVAFAHVAHLGHVVLPAQSTSYSMKFYVERYRGLAGPDTPLVFFGKPRYSMFYYLGKDSFRAFEESETEAAAAFLRTTPRAFLIAEREELPGLLEELRGTGQRWFRIAEDYPRYTLLVNYPVPGASGSSR